MAEALINPDVPYEARMLQLARRRKEAMDQVAAANKQQKDLSEGRMVGGQYIRPHWSQQASAAIQQAMGTYYANKADTDMSQAEANEGQAAQKYVETMPRARTTTTNLPGPQPEDMQGQPLQGTTTTQPTREEMTSWAVKGAIKHPSLRASLTKAYEDQLINEPVRDEVRQNRVDDTKAAALDKATARQEKMAADAQLLQQRLEDRSLDRASREKLAGQHDELMREIAAGNQDLRRLQIEAAASAAENKAKAPKPPSAAQQKAMADNEASMNFIDEALADVDKNPDAFGLKNTLPEGLTQRLPGAGFSGGVGTRASVMNIGSRVIHDRSGASTTVAEMPRLAPFIPNPTDSAETVKTKMKGLRRQIEIEQGAMTGQDTSQGQPRPPSPRGQGSTARPRSQADFDRLPSGTTFIDPDDGKTYQKP
jgi:hypothetical protein